MAGLAPTSLISRKSVRAGALLTILLWGAALLLWAARDIASGSAFPLPYRLVLLGTFLIGIGFSALLAFVLTSVQRLGRVWRVLATGVTAVTLAVLHGWIDAYMLDWMRDRLGLKASPIFDLFLSGIMPFLLIYGLYAMALGLMLSAMTTRQREIQLAQARSAAQQAQLAALRFQLNPHFLFNTLNAISSLIVTNRNDEAERMTGKLSEFLRVSLETDPETEVTLDGELATTQSYLDIELVRFGNRLRVDFACPTALLEAYVPSLLLQPLVENSIKYAVAPTRHPVTLSVRASSEAGQLCLVVEDDGRKAFGGKPSGSTGLGLANVRQRLAAFYGEGAQVQAIATERGFTVTLLLPLRFAPAIKAAE